MSRGSPRLTPAVALLTLLAVACGAPAPVSAPPSPAVSASATLCPNVVTVQKFIDAMVRFDGQAAAALFSTDGFVQTNFTRSGQPERFVGAQRIEFVIARVEIREREIIEQPRGCDTVTWVQRELPVLAGRGTVLRGTATVQDGKLSSVVFVVQQQ